MFFRGLGLVVGLKNRLVVALLNYNLFYGRHATVAQFEGVSVKDFPQFVANES